MSMSSSVYPLTRKSSTANARERAGCSSWIWEVLNFLVSFLCIGAIIIILAKFNDKPLPKLGWLTLNGIVSTLAGISKAALILPISEAISQLKWHWFWNADRPRPISDFQIYDSASRGPWGSICLLARPRLLHMSSVGALLTVVALAIEPFLQLVPSYSTRMTAQLGSHATVPAVGYFEQIEHDPLNFDMVTAGQGMKGAVYNGMYASSNVKVATPTCPTGNCTWEPYTSLAVCSSCTNLTEMLVYAPPSGYMQWQEWRLPNDLRTGNASSLKQSTGTGEVGNPDAPDHGNWSINYPHMQNMSIITAQSFFWAPQTSNISDASPHAAECILYFCVQTYNATVVDGQFTETLVETWPDPKEPLPASLTNQWSVGLLKKFNGVLPMPQDQYDETLPSNVSIANITYTPPKAGSIDHSVNLLTLFGLRSWFSENWNMEMTEQDFTRDMIQVAYNSYTGDSRSTMRPNGPIEAVAAISRMPGPAPLWADVADSMTTHLRNQGLGQTPAQGVAFAATTYVSVRWEWAILPIVLLILTLAFVVFTVAVSVEKEIPLWKSNSLPTLLYNVDSDVADSIVGFRRPAEKMEATAKSFEMAMKAEDSTLRLWARAKESRSIYVD
ncbi:hypothetical protein Slin14017_G092740 [Septoria linicola]|nr:hypothetical protein Slin14017_G092740 [Septoria linicola]